MRVPTVFLCLLVVVSVSLSWTLSAFSVGRAWQNNISESNDPRALKILFIGNSKFYWHDMPKMLAYLLKSDSPNRSLKISEVLGDAFTLEEHWNDGTARKLIRERGPWDYVVLGERTGVAETPSEAWQFEKALNQFSREIKAANARLILFESYNDDEDRAEDPNTHRAYTSAAQKYGGYVVPVGPAWRAVRDSRPNINLFSSDNHHPSLAGTYLMACVFYSFFTGKTAQNLPIQLNYDDSRAGTRYVVNGSGEGQALQSAAWAAVSRLSQPR